jgi:hypothetical protein
MEDDFSYLLMGITATVRLILDNEKNCKFDKVVLDAITFCFINDFSDYMNYIKNLSTNWAEAVFALNSAIATVISSSIYDFSLENDYKFYHTIGESTAILLTDIIDFKP